MLFDSGAPDTCNGEPWLKNYCETRGLKKEDLKSRPCRQRFQFGTSIGESYEKVEIPILVKERNTGKIVAYKIESAVVDIDVPFLLGDNDLEKHGENRLLN